MTAHDACLASAASVFSLSSRSGPEGTATQLLMPPTQNALVSQLPAEESPKSGSAHKALTIGPTSAAPASP